ncbi:Flp pilus assembly protein CpaB [Actibacterium lipolyticum]|uniref:SAF domain-containing protein n=1 Tax=Actibacterium lipolyticum TaxID=1524263 RepID=A0A238KMU9_9RHOB|nr:Flp pilus assembly protein CpaB [Actibacterium lipolyticum]SMX43990.1 hypothetical protein COL8621_02432 [Actibacterium lipolyticum]
MRMLFGLVLLIGLGLAGFAVYMVQGYVSQYQAALAQEQSARAEQIQLTEIYIADRALAYGEPITLEDAKLVQWPANHVPEGAFKVESDLFPDGTDMSRIVLRPMEKNEPLLAVKVTAPGEDAGIASRLGGGARAFTISIDASSGVSGFLRPGDRVDVYWTGTVKGRAKVTKLIIPSLQLMAVDQSSDSGRQSPAIARTVTLRATSDRQVAALTLAEQTGKLSLSLVGALDETLSNTVEIDQNTLLGIEEEEEVVEVKPQEKCVRVERRGTERFEIPIPCTN